MTRYNVKLMVKRLRNCSALSKIVLEIDNRAYELMDGLFAKLDEPFVLLTLVMRGECAQ